MAASIGDSAADDAAEDPAVELGDRDLHRDVQRGQAGGVLEPALARLRSVPNAEKRIALVLSSYPTKHSRVGNAVGLDTPASAVALLAAMRDAGYAVEGVPDDGDTLIHTLIAAGGHDVEWLTEQ